MVVRYALCPDPRNVPDDVLHLVKENDGVVMINFYPQFVSCGPGKFPANATLSMVADHIEHIGKLIGWDHVGLGSDFDGMPNSSSISTISPSGPHYNHNPR